MLDEEEQSPSESQPERPRPSPSPEPLEDKGSLEEREADGRTLCRDLDPFHVLRSQLTQLGFERGEYAGIPVPVQGIPLTVDPSYPFAKAWDEINRITNPEKLGPSWVDQYDVVNVFYSSKKRCDILVLRDKRTGKNLFRLKPAVHSLNQTMATLFASDVWGIDQEQAALQTLGGMLRHRQFKQYLLTGMFLERSSRSGVSYLFRRLRPTVAINAIRPGQEDSEEDALILCTLCMHPIAYYSGSWAGAMTPTDDVIAHLSLMRGDEHMFWKRCNQHPAYRPESGL